MGSLEQIQMMNRDQPIRRVQIRLDIYEHGDIKYHCFSDKICCCEMKYNVKRKWNVCEIKMKMCFPFLCYQAELHQILLTN
jgi:hypothetical protein